MEKRDMGGMRRRIVQTKIMTASRIRVSKIREDKIRVCNIITPMGVKMVRAVLHPMEKTARDNTLRMDKGTAGDRSERMVEGCMGKKMRMDRGRKTDRKAAKDRASKAAVYRAGTRASKAAMDRGRKAAMDRAGKRARKAAMDRAGKTARDTAGKAAMGRRRKKARNMDRKMTITGHRNMAGVIYREIDGGTDSKMARDRIMTGKMNRMETGMRIWKIQMYRGASGSSMPVA